MKTLASGKWGLLSLMIVLFYGGCVPRGADGRYHSVYSYHPYNKMYASSTPIRSQVKRPVKHAFFTPPHFEKREKRSFADKRSLLQIESLAKSQLGKRYRWGANGPYDFDCSGFTKFVYAHNGVNLPRVSRDQAKVGKRVDVNHLQKGDLIFFDSSKSSRVSHTGIYLGDNQFIHASSSKKKVVVSRLQGYYRKHFKWGRRVIQ